jgi:hypothetical protein
MAQPEASTRAEGRRRNSTSNSDNSNARTSASAWGSRGYVVVALVAVLLMGYQQQSQTQSGWDATKAPEARDAGGEVCNIERRTELSCEEFVSDFLGRKPVVFTRPLLAERTTTSDDDDNDSNDRDKTKGSKSPSSSSPNERSGSAQSDFARLTERGSLLGRFGHERVRVSTANSYTGKEWHHISLEAYLSDSIQQDKSKAGNETWYLFGGVEWPGLLDEYQGAQLPSVGIVAQQQHLGGGGGGGPTSSEGERLLMGESVDANDDAQNASRSLSVLKRAAMDMCSGGQSAVDRINDFITLSFGIAGKDTGVPFHFHGPGFLQGTLARTLTSILFAFVYMYECYICVYVCTDCVMCACRCEGVFLSMRVSQLASQVSANSGSVITSRLTCVNAIRCICIEHTSTKCVNQSFMGVSVGSCTHQTQMCVSIPTQPP